jgi:DNA-binding NtrC family response regulator
LTILVVEDEWVVRFAIVEFLKSAACNVIEAHNGEAAVDILHDRDRVDVVFTDIRLGGKVTGWDVGQASRARDPAMPVIYTSGAVPTPERRVENSRFFTKPYDQESVLSACRELCGGRR